MLQSVETIVTGRDPTTAADVATFRNYSSSSRVGTIMITTAFDPHAAAVGDALGLGITRLQFKEMDNFGELAVNSLPAAVTFSLPLGPDLGPDYQPQCQFWDPQLNSYSTRGCAAVPVTPPGMEIAIDRKLAASGLSINASWVMTGSLAKDLLANCTRTILDCPRDTGKKVYLDPFRPLSIPAVQCAPGRSLKMLVFNGTGCKIWNPERTPCYWNATAQGFSGNCGNRANLQCACTHLTDFQGGTGIKLQVASLQQMLSLSADDIFVKQRMFAGIVFGLFGLMLLAAGALFPVDLRVRQAALANLKKRDFGFRSFGGAWTWSLSQSGLGDAVDRAGGTAVNVAGIIGIPFVRLRAAIPEELMPGSMALALGRQEQLLSVKGVEELNHLVIEKKRAMHSGVSGKPAATKASLLSMPSQARCHRRTGTNRPRCVCCGACLLRVCFLRAPPWC